MGLTTVQRATALPVMKMTKSRYVTLRLRSAQSRASAGPGQGLLSP